MKITTKIMNFIKDIFKMVLVVLVLLLFLSGTEITLKFNFNRVKQTIKKGIVAKVKDSIHIVKDVSDVIN